MIIETIEYKGYSINIHHEEGAECPHTSWDGVAPLIVNGGRRDGIDEYGDVPSPYELTREQVKENLLDILQTLGYPATMRGLLTFARYEGHADITESVNRALEHYENYEVSNVDKFEYLQERYSWAGIKTLLSSVTGYCQSDCYDVLAIASPEWLAETGVEPEHVEKALQSSVDLFGWWAFGDVYGFTITAPNGEELDDSCWGFYGNDHEKSGLLEHARPSIDYRIVQANKEAKERKYWECRDLITV